MTILPDVFVKVSRRGEMFWLKDINVLAPEIYVGTCDNHLSADHHFKFGDQVPFAQCEVIELRTKPRLAVANDVEAP